MATINPQLCDLDGTQLVFSACAAGGDQVPIGSGVIVHVRNAHATLPRTVTAVVPGNTFNGQAAPDTAITVAALQQIGFVLDDRYRDPTTLRAHLTYSDSAADLTIAAVGHI